jgi:hypothetical protein
VAGPFSYVMRERDPRLALRTLQGMLSSGSTTGGGKIGQRASPPIDDRQFGSAVKAHREGHALVVKTAEDEYRLDPVTARIARMSDGAALRVDIPWAHPEFQFLRAQVDAHDFNQPGKPNWLSVAICARVLTDSRFADRIAEDPTAG